MICSFKASGDYAPSFVSENIKRLLGYCPDKYLKNADFWNPEDLPQVEAEQVKVFEQERHSSEYRFRNVDGMYLALRRRGPLVLHLNLQKRDKAEAIHILEGILARLKA